MALTDYKITNEDITNNGVVSQPDKLTGTAAENKAVFDALIREVVKGKLNDLIDALITELSGKMPAPGNYGAANTYLKTDGEGNVSWDSPLGNGDMLKSVYDLDDDGTVGAADYATEAGNAATAGTAESAAACTGNAATATKLGTARKIYISDKDGANTGTGVDFDGSAAATLKLPAIIKANITGNASGSSGSCTGNAATATKLGTARTIALTDADGTNSGTSISFDGSGNKTLKLPATIKATITGNAATATKLATARTIGLTDADGTNTGTSISFDGSGNKTLKLPGTIKANLTGNCSGNAATATKLATARKIGNANFDGSAAITLSDMGAAAASHTHGGSDITNYSGTGTNNPGARRIYISTSQPTGSNGDVWIKYTA